MRLWFKKYGVVSILSLRMMVIFVSTYCRRCLPFPDFGKACSWVSSGRFFPAVFMLVAGHAAVVAQEINFQVSAPDEVVITPLSPQKLSFQPLTFSGSEVRSIGLRGKN